MHAVEIALRNGVELVIVAARAAYRQAEEHLRGSVDVVGELLHHVHVFHLKKHVAIGSHAIVAGPHARLRLVRIQLVCRDLLFGEAVVRLVVIERLDHIIAEAPGLQIVRILLEAGGVAIAHQIQPMPSPLLAIARRGQQRIDQMLPGLRRAVVQEFAQLFRRGRQAVQVEAGAAQ